MPSSILRSSVVVVGFAGRAARGIRRAPDLHAQSATAAERFTRDPDVQGAQRLFTAWLEGQMLSRHLPGVAIGVVADQDLVWAPGSASPTPRRSGR